MSAHEQTPANEAPDYNGLSAEGYLAGISILDAWRSLRPEVREEIMPHLMNHMANEMLSGTSLSGLDEARAAALSAADLIGQRAARIRTQLRPVELRPEDY